jgi:hypothetical protein
VGSIPASRTKLANATLCGGVSKFVMRSENACLLKNNKNNKKIKVVVHFEEL